MFQLQCILYSILFNTITATGYLLNIEHANRNAYVCMCLCELLRTRQQARVNACDIDTSHTDAYDNSITHNWIFVRARIINGKSRPASKTYLQLPYEHEKLSCNFWSLLIPVLRYKSNIIAIEYNLYNTRFLSISLHLVYVSFVACTYVVRVRFMVGPCYRTYQY